MNRYGSRKHRVAAGLAMVALMVVVAVVATTVEEPEANALPFGGGVPVRIYFNPDPAKYGDMVQLWVELSEEATLIPHVVMLEYPSDIQAPGNNLQNDHPSVIVAVGEKSNYVNFQACSQNATTNGYVAVIAKLNGGRAGGVLEVQP